jgi:hypothetical protein
MVKGRNADKSKWALAFDEGGKRYGIILTTNNSESLNNLLKGIRSRPIASIIEYSFQKCSEYFVDRWNKARSALQTGQVLGKIAHEHIEAAELRSVNQIGNAFGPERMIYGIYGAGGTNIGGESHGGRNYRVDLWSEECMCMLPQLLHMPCFHLITACKCRGINYKGPSYLSPWYERSNTLKVWESSFESYPDPTQWPDYNGLEYIPDSDLVKDKKERRQTKRLKGDMDASQGRFSSDYGTGDFEEDKSRNRCSKCHKFCNNCKCRKKKAKVKKKANNSAFH